MMGDTGKARGLDWVTETLRQLVFNKQHLGLLASGARLPSVRTIARELDVNPKLVLVAYRILESEGVVEVRSRAGVFVAAPGKISSASSASEWLVNTLVAARQRRIALPRISELFAKATSNVRLRALVVDRTDDGLWSMGDELEREFGIIPERVDLDSVNEDWARGLADKSPSAHIIVTSTFERKGVREAAAQLRVPVCAVTLCEDFYAQVRDLLAKRAVYFVVADPRFAAKLRLIFGAAEGGRRLHVLIYGRDALEVPSDAPVYLTRLVRRKMWQDGVEHPLMGRCLPEAQLFSDETTRELSRFVVGANFFPAAQ